MDYYNILGIDENASQEEIRQAYEKQVKKFKEEIKDEKRAEKFLRLFDEAYEALREKEEIRIENDDIRALIMKMESDNSSIAEEIKEKPIIQEIKEASIIEEVKNTLDNNILDRTMIMTCDDIIDKTVIMTSEEILKEKNNINGSFEEVLEEEKIIKKRSGKYNSRSKSKDKKTSNNKKDSSKKTEPEFKDKENDIIRDRINDKDFDNDSTGKRVKKQKVVVRKESNTNNLVKLLLIPFKILALPIIAILSVIIFILKILSLATWVASKIIMVGAISIAAIHSYQIYVGHVPMQWQIFAGCIIGALVSIFLPLILRIFPGIVEKINNIFKRFVFGK